ncbi:hypothetical protein BGZ61DRAFT_453751 [Ilyonectria robusta]|uniref:uncharacterized protein n=1 Tax=Ilyonectria robusta TaxID=1079257 RepID=UPI001E8D9C60|nr:uncharacterized protein BGZ61DRAFT_453751 [Ilyonectria robusta]KAH8686853.1 hypothetical protein BGZ61DRAFT_453751 [Ilyonectria robusta]
MSVIAAFLWHLFPFFFLRLSRCAVPRCRNRVRPFVHLSQGRSQSRQVIEAL